MPVKCDYCGAESEIEEAYGKVPRSFSPKARRICPSCVAAKRQTKFKRLKWYWLGTILFGGALLFDSGTRTFGFYVLNWTLFDFCLMLTILPHELGHAAMGKLVGFRIFRVVVGSGRNFFRRRVWGFLLELNRIPFGGLTGGASKERDGIKWRHALFIIGGPAVNIVLGYAAYLIAPRPFWPLSAHNFSDNPILCVFESFGAKLLPLQLIVMSNLYVLVVNLWPRRLRTSYGVIPSDGLALLRTVFMKEERIKELLASYYIGQSLECFEKRQYTEAQRWAEEGLRQYPGHEGLINHLGVGLLQQLRFDEARKVFLTQIDPPSKNPVVHAMVLNNLAYADVLLEDASLLEEADKCSSLALAKIPWNPSIKGTRGAVLIETGRVEEGIKLLQEAIAAQEYNDPKAINACFLAIAERKLGHTEVADTYLKLAERLEPKCFLLERARREV